MYSGSPPELYNMYCYTDANYREIDLWMMLTQKVQNLFHFVSLRYKRLIVTVISHLISCSYLALR